MCRGYQKQERDRLNIKAFHVCLSFSRNHNNSHLPHSLTLRYLPRKDGKALEINGSRIQSDSQAFVALHRVVLPERVMRGAAMYSSRERMIAGEGLRFEIYMNDVNMLSGIFQKDQGQNWKIDCKCGVENDDMEDVKEADVCVELEGDVAIVSEKVDIGGIKRRRSRRIKGRRRFVRLEEIPEEKEIEMMDASEPDGCGCDCKSEVGTNDGDLVMGGMRWGVDVGVWIVCLGVGYLVTQVSSKCIRNLVV